MKYIILFLLLVVLISGCIYFPTGEIIDKERIKKELENVMEKINKTSELEAKQEDVVVTEEPEAQTKPQTTWEEPTFEPNPNQKKPEESHIEETTEEPMPEEPELCTEFWFCSDWSACIDGVQTRTCTDQNNCATEENKPAETKTCTEQPEITHIESGKGREKLDEWVEISGYGIELTNWTISDAANHIFTFPNITISGSIKIHTGYGENNQTDLFWNSGRPIWNNDGDTATLKDSNGNIVDVYAY